MSLSLCSWAARTSRSAPEPTAFPEARWVSPVPITREQPLMSRYSSTGRWAACTQARGFRMWQCIQRVHTPQLLTTALSSAQEADDSSWRKCAACSWEQPLCTGLGVVHAWRDKHRNLTSSAICDPRALQLQQIDMKVYGAFSDKTPWSAVTAWISMRTCVEESLFVVLFLIATL